MRLRKQSNKLGYIKQESSCLSSCTARLAIFWGTYDQKPENPFISVCNYKFAASKENNFEEFTTLEFY